MLNLLLGDLVGDNTKYLDVVRQENKACDLNEMVSIFCRVFVEVSE